MQQRNQSQGEEIANSLSHGVALLASAIALPVLIVFGRKGRDTLELAGIVVFGIALIILYLASTLYHTLPDGRPKRVFQRIDHTAIFILIAGTYTPFALGILRGQWGWTLLGLIWCLAVFGIVMEWAGKLRKKLSNILYLAMGWSAIIVVKPIFYNMAFEGLVLLAAGGLFYTFGIYFYIKDRKKYFHFIWHIFVVAGSISHFFAVLWYA